MYHRPFNQKIRSSNKKEETHSHTRLDSRARSTVRGPRLSQCKRATRRDRMSADPWRTKHDGRKKTKRLEVEEMRSETVLVLLVSLFAVLFADEERRLVRHGGREQRCARLARNLRKRATYYGGSAARGYCPTRCYQRYCQCPVSNCRRRCPYHTTATSIYDGKDWYGPKYGEWMKRFR